MITLETAGYLIDQASGTRLRAAVPGEVFPDRAPPAPPAGPSRLRRGLRAVLATPSLVAGQAARLVPAPVKARLAARAEARALALGIRRLEALSPHLLADIGIWQVAAGTYEAMPAAQVPASDKAAEPAPAPSRPEPAAPTVRPAPQLWRLPPARRPPAAIAGTVAG